MLFRRIIFLLYDYFSQMDQILVSAIYINMSKFLLIIAAQKPLFHPKCSDLTYVFFKQKHHVSAFVAYRRFSSTGVDVP